MTKEQENQLLDDPKPALGYSAWEPGMTVQIGATYREKATGILMQIEFASCGDNHLRLAPPVQKWEGSSQEFAEEFELVAPYEKVPPQKVLLSGLSEHWPATYRGRIPVKVRMARDLGPDMWPILGNGTPRIWVKKDEEIAVKCNQHGAMSLLTPHGDLGVKPLACEIIEWATKQATKKEGPPK